MAAHIVYGKCAKISITLLLLFSNKMLAIRIGTHKMLVRKITNREDPDQTASSEAVRSGSAPFV